MINGRGDPGYRAGLDGDADADMLDNLAGFVGQRIELASDAPSRRRWPPRCGRRWATGSGMSGYRWRASTTAPYWHESTGEDDIAGTGCLT
jgi:hypothetical protein